MRSKTTTPATAPAQRPATASRHDRNVATSAAWNRRQSAIGRDIGTIPPVANPARRAAAEGDFRRFCEAYMPATFTLAWSPDHLRAIAKIEAAVLHGELFAFAMPRGSGKTSLVEAAAVWSLLFGHRDFVVVVGADEGHARRMLDSCWLEFETNDLLLEDFPEVCHPIRSLERITQRARGQMHAGQPTRLTKAAGEIVLPTVAGSAASGAVVRAVGITGGIRGLASKRADGTRFRPSLVLIDDLQTDEVSGSPKQVADRLAVMNGAVLGLAGPGKTIAGLATVTVIRPGDLADQLLDRAAHPAWQGERSALVYEWPKAEQLWERYAEMRRDGQRSGAGVAAATEFYAAHRDEMDAGSRVAWPERHNPDELSALQHAYNLRIDRGESAFAAEYQNQPLAPTLVAPVIDRAALRAREIKLDRGMMPSGHSTLTVGIDVQDKLLFWLVASWGSGYGGHVVAYGAYPEQGTSMFTAATAKRTLRQAHPGTGFEAALLAGLTGLVDDLLGRDWLREDGTRQRIDAAAVDANWGKSTQVIREFTRRHRLASMIHPAHGRGIGAATQPLNDGKKRAGERIGPGWRLGTIGGQRGLLFDANFWKSFLASRLATAVGDHGALTFHRGQHEMLAEHLAAEQPVTVTARGRTVDEWKCAPGADNHWLDCLVMAAVAASVAGIAAPGAEATQRRRRKVEIPTGPGNRRVIQVRPFVR